MASARRWLGSAAGSLLVGCASPPVLVDADPATGFALYRSGWLEQDEIAELCAAGVEEIVVLDGTGRERECRWRESACPRLRVRWDRRQSAERALDSAFLAAFDAWVEEARAAGRGIAFRCRHGWHRTGRLAAYYAMRHQARDAGTARREMHRRGRFMWRHPALDPQVEALADYLAGRPCGESPAHCLAAAESAGRPATFPEDVCPEPSGEGVPASGSWR
ncbi:MAG: hypothetical protein ACRD0X_01600 [Thermoanaerobaculia bacterium]